MKNVHNGLGVENMSHLILKEIYGIYERENLIKEQIKRWKMTAIGIFEKYDNLSEDELYIKNNKEVYVRNDLMTFVIKHCRGEKNEVKKKKKKQQTNDSKI